jgi:hypothetical protein
VAGVGEMVGEVWMSRSGCSNRVGIKRDVARYAMRLAMHAVSAMMPVRCVSVWSFFARTNHERTKLPFRPALSPHPHADRYLFCLGRKICALFKIQPFQRRQLHACLVSNTERACHKFRFVCVQNGSRFYLCHPFVGVVQE